MNSHNIISLIIETTYYFWKNNLGMHTKVIEILFKYINNQNFISIKPNIFIKSLNTYFCIHEDFQVNNEEDKIKLINEFPDFIKSDSKFITNPNPKINNELEYRSKILLNLFLKLLDNEKSIDTNLFETVIPNELITIGISNEAKLLQKNYHNEHIVPRILIRDEIINLSKKSCSEEKMINLIINNLKVIIISKDEAKRLDTNYKLKVVMPDSWQFGDNIFERLQKAEIEYTLY